MPLIAAARQELESDVGSTTRTPIHPTRSLAPNARRGVCRAGKQGEICSAIGPRIRLSQTAILSRKARQPLTRRAQSGCKDIPSQAAAVNLRGASGLFLRR
jgi:hypothetical protein